MLADKTDNPNAAQGSSANRHDGEEQKYILVQVALRLFHTKGYNKVKFIDIAKAAGMTNKEAQSHFGSRTEICHLVIDAHLDKQKALFAKINQDSNPRQRLSLYLDDLVENTDTLIALGCAMTNLYFDVKREEKQLADHAAKILQQQLDWIREQFILVTRVENITDLPERLAGAIHGISILAQVTGNAALIRNQVNQLKSWIRSM